MKNYRAIFLTAILFLTIFSGAAKAQTVSDSYFADQVKLTKPEKAESKSATSENTTAPANDNFGSAETITMGAAGTTIVARSTAGATKEEGEPDHADNPGGKSVWFNFTPTVTTPVEMRTTNQQTDFDTTLAVYTGDSLETLVPAGSNDDCYRSECGVRSRVRLLLVAGTTYRIAIDGYSSSTTPTSSGNVTLIIDEYSLPFAFDNIADAYDLNFAKAGSIAMTNHFATIEPNEPGHAGTWVPGGKSVWFKFRTTSDRAMTFQMTNNFAGEMAVYQTSAANPTFAQLTRLDENVENINRNGGRTEVNFMAYWTMTYYIVIDYNGEYELSQTGNFQLKFFQTKLRYSTRLAQDDNSANVSIYRPVESKWYTKETLSPFSNNHYVKFGKPGDTPVPADYDGDAITDYAVVRIQNGVRHWYILRSSDPSTFTQLQWGLASDIAVTGDFDHDGRADVGVVRNVDGQLVWYINQSSNNQMRAFVFGLTNDRPIIGDFDGDGRTEISVIRSSGGKLIWYSLLSKGVPYTQMSVVEFGLTADLRVPEDYDGDGKTDIAIWRPSDYKWYILRSSTNEVQVMQFGATGDTPVPADYDNDGKADLAVYRPDEGKWYFRLSESGSQYNNQWGVATDTPVSSLGMLIQ